MPIGLFCRKRVAFLWDLHCQNGHWTALALTILGCDVAMLLNWNPDGNQTQLMKWYVTWWHSNAEQLCPVKEVNLVCVWGPDECRLPIMSERGTLLLRVERLGWPWGMLLLRTLFPFSPNAPCPIRLIVLFSRTRYPGVPGAREGRRGP